MNYKKTSNCIVCDISFEHYNTALGKYCSSACQKSKENKDRVDNWLAGNDRGWSGPCRKLRPFIRRYLFEVFGSKCSECGWDERHPIDGAILTEIDHIDGDCENCVIKNLRVLCPNCHAKTSTYRNRNKTSKRER